MKPTYEQHCPHTPTGACSFCYVGQSRDADRLRKKEAHLFDVYDSLGIKWGDDPFHVITTKKEIIRKIRECCKRGIKRAEIQELGYKNPPPQSQTELHFLTVVNALKQDMEEALTIYPEVLEEKP